jgi:hypothetical protein
MFAIEPTLHRLDGAVVLRECGLPWSKTWRTLPGPTLGFPYAAYSTGTSGLGAELCTSARSRCERQGSQQQSLRTQIPDRGVRLEGADGHWWQPGTMP